VKKTTNLRPAWLIEKIEAVRNFAWVVMVVEADASERWNLYLNLKDDDATLAEYHLS